MSHFTDFTGYVVFIITSFLAGVESADQCLLNPKVLSCFSGVIMSIRSFFLLIGCFGEIVGFHKTLNDQETLYIREYLMKKWRITNKIVSY